MKATESLMLEKAGLWLLHSGIQNPDGGVARYRRLDENRNLPVSTEITGYAASTFAYLYSRTGEGAYRKRAMHTAEFLLSCWRDDWNAMPFEISGSASYSYFFDCGIVVRGLLAVHEIAPDSQLLAAARKIGLAMAGFRGPRGINPILALPGKEPLEWQSRWSKRPGCYQLKSAMAWRNLAAHFPDDPFHDWYLQALDEALSDAVNYLPGDLDEEQVMDRLHPFCYFLEGLLPTANSSVLEDGIARVGGYLRAISHRFERSDVCAQLLRLRVYSRLPIDTAAAEDEARRIAGHQHGDGGYGFGTKEGAVMPFVNPVSTAFCLQALDAWQHRQAGTPSFLI